MPEHANSRIFYEQPLNERVRSFLRLEHLFQRAAHQLQSHDIWSSRDTLETVIDIMALLSRADFKAEVIKELERHAATLEGLACNPGVDPTRLTQILGRVRELLHALRTTDSAPGAGLRGHELLNAVKQRYSIPAGTCDFDLPLLHFWLRNPPQQRSEELSQWLSTFDVLRDAIALCLGLVRESATATREIAFKGFFQKTLDSGTPCQLVRVAVSTEAPWYPEISAGRHRFTVRFMCAPDPQSRPVQTQEDVVFDLLCCVL
jgi:cell division protein ZapD